jgi:flagellar hook assembly protein FlgD
LLFPAPVRRGTLYAIRLRTRVFLGNTQFSAQLLNAALPERTQQISAGDATELVASQSLVAVADLSGRSLLEEVEITPPICTPNGDGINDQLEITAKVFAVEGGRGLRIEIFDLSGRRLRDLSQKRLRPSGEYRILWDGRDERDRLVPPGTYLLRLKLATDAPRRGSEAVRLVQVAY